MRIVVNDRRLGHNENFFKAAGLCEGDLIAFSDQDDVWLPTKLETCVAALERGDALVTHHRAVLVDAELRDIGMLDQFIPHDRVVERLGMQPLTGMAFGFTIVMRRELRAIIDKDLRPHESEWPDRLIAYDAWYFLLASLFGRISQIHEPLAKYRQHARNISGHQRLSLAERLRAYVEAPLGVYRSRLQFSEEVARMLAQVAPTLPPEAAFKAREGAEFYRIIAGHLRRRVALFEARSLSERLMTFAGLVSSGAYRPREQAGLGRKSTVRDFLGGVLKLGAVRTASTTA